MAQRLCVVLLYRIIMKSWDCKYSDKIVERSTNSALHKARKKHVIDKHYEEIGQELLQSDFNNCQICSRPLPNESTEDPLECSYCGHIHDEWWAGEMDASTWDIG